MAHPPERWRQPLALALAAAALADAADAARAPLPPCIERDERAHASCWPGPTAAILAGTAAEPSAAAGTGAGRSTNDDVDGPPAARLDALELSGVSAAGESPPPLTMLLPPPPEAGAPLDRSTPLLLHGDTAGGGGTLAAGAVAVVLRAEALTTCTHSSPAAASAADHVSVAAVVAVASVGRAAPTGTSARAAALVADARAAHVAALLFADESLLALEPSGQLWARTRPRDAGRPADAASAGVRELYAAGAVPPFVELDDGRRVELRLSLIHI
mgnify:CR=1 FL=1